jgi:hypothetical protein
MSQTIIPPPRKTSGLAKWTAGARRWAHRNFTRDNLIQALKTFASVGPLTILIWIYAEREGIQTQRDVSIAIEVRCIDPSRIVSLQKPYPEKVVVADLAGPAGTLDNVIQRLERHSGDEPAVEIFVDPTLTTGMVHSDIDTAQELAHNAMFQGVTITNCQPPKLAVLVDQLEEKEIEVQAPPGITNLTGPPVFTPHTVKVRGPKESIDALGDKLVAVADLTGLDGMNVPGPHDFPVVRVQPLEDPNLSFTPPNVEAVVSVRESDVSGTIRSVPIWVFCPPDLMGKYRVDLANPVLTNVKVTGPADKIAMVNQPDFSPKPRARLAISGDDEPGKPLQRQVTFDLADLGLHVDEQHTVDFSLVEIHGNE